MVRWRNGLAGALALVATAQVSAQSPDSTVGQENLVIVDGRIGAEALAAVRKTLEEPELPNFALMNQVGGCGVPFTRSGVGSLTGRAPTSGAPSHPFDLDTALRSAAGSDGQTAPASILLIAQGSSDCLSIGCALAASLANQYNDIRINVIGLSDAAVPLTCLATNTGAQFKRVTIDALPAAIKGMLPAQVTIAAESKAEAGPETEATKTEHREDAKPAAEQSDRSDTAALSTPPQQPAGTENRESYPPLPKPRPDQSADAPPTDAAKDGQQERVEPFQWAALPPGAPENEQVLPPGQSGALIRVLAGPKGPLVESQLAFEILSSEGDGSFRRVANSAKPNPFFPLPPGRYVARVSHGEVVREFPFMVGSDTADLHTFSLDLGYLNLQAQASATAAPLESGIVYTVYRINSDASGKPIVTRMESQPMIALPAGSYRVMAALDAAKIVADIEITAGQTLRHQFDFNLGYLRVSVMSDAEDIGLRIEKPSTGGPDGPTAAFAEHQGNSALFRLPAGRYNAVASVDGGQAHETVTVEQGKLTTITLKLQTAANRPPQQ